MKLPMKLLRTAGLCLVAMLVMSMVAAGTASAAVPTWETCGTKGAAEANSKYAGEECTEASSTGKYAWEEVKGTEAAIGLGTLILRDTKVPIEGTVEVSCTGEAIGSVGPGAFSRTEKIENISCTAGKDCEELVKKTVEPRNLPWQGELKETEKAARNYISNGKTGKEAPGWAVTCRVLGIEKTDVCTISTGYTAVSNLFDPYHGTTQNVWLALLDFIESAPKANCEVGGEKSGEVIGSIGILMSANRGGLLARFH
jgi:hypothetical protein